MKKYKKPGVTVLIYGEISEKIVDKLRGFLKIHGPRGLRVILVSSSSIKALEYLRDVLLDNYSFTLEVYTASSDLVEKLYNANRLGEVVAVLASSSEIAKQVPSSLSDKVIVI
ncbi:MAG: hypothetical protein LM567_05890 [Desulfurococcaceae archaeon]|nr:hypothetical protein [Desulfurococcaceae archaeon]